MTELILDGIEVIDLSMGIAGPLTATILADFGASVTKVEPPAGDPLRDTPAFSACNRGKRSVVLDPTSPDDRARLAALIAVADVCVTNGAASLDAYGIADDALPARLVLAEVVASESSLTWKGGEESHGLLAAVSGVAMRQGSTDGGPIEFVTPHILYLQAVWAAACTVSALYEQTTSGLGQRVVVSGVNAAMLAVCMDLTTDPSVVVPQMSMATTGSNPFYTHYQAGDGRWFLCGGMDPKFGRRILDDVGLSSVYEDQSLTQFEDLYLPEHSDRLRKIFEDLYLTKSSQEWMDWLDGLGVPNGPLLERDEWLRHPQIEAMGLHAEVEETGHGTVEMPGVTVGLSRTPGRVVRGAPGLGEHNGELGDTPARANTSGSASSDRSGTSAKAGPLSGVRVLNLGAFIAGPSIGSLLAELGAEVIKIEPPVGDPFRGRAFAYNRGMKSVALDLKDDGARRAFQALVRASDVVVDNARQGVLPRIGADYDSLRALNPDIITVSASAFGEEGDMAKKAGFDLVFEAASGVMADQGGDGGPLMITLPLIDIMSGTLAALGGVLALYGRARGLGGQRVTTSLAAASLMFQAGELVRYAGSPAPRRGALDYRGADAGDRFYQVRDGWVRLQVPSSRAAELATFVVEAGVLPAERTAGAGVDLGSELEARFAELTQDEAIAAFSASPVIVVPTRTGSDVSRQTALREAGLMELHQTKDGRTYTLPGRMAGFSRTPRTEPHMAPGIGEHTRELLGAVGLSSSEIDDLIERGVSAQGGPFDPPFLPNP